MCQELPGRKGVREPHAKEAGTSFPQSHKPLVVENCVSLGDLVRHVEKGRLVPTAVCRGQLGKQDSPASTASLSFSAAPRRGMVRRRYIWDHSCMRLVGSPMAMPLGCLRRVRDRLATRIAVLYE